MSRAQSHHNDHDHNHGHDHPHPHAGHNHDAGHDHLHSHAHGGHSREQADELKTLSTSFVEGFRQAADKTSFLRLAGVPFQREGNDGLTMHLVDTQIVSNWQIGTASPAFGTREMVYLPYPGPMVTGRETMTFTYVSLTQREDRDLMEFLQAKQDVAA